MFEPERVPSRRNFLGALTSVGTIAVAGCSREDGSRTGIVTRRTAEVNVSTPDGGAWLTLATARFDLFDASLRVEYDPEFAAFDEAAKTMTVTDHDQLLDRFRNARYGIVVDPGPERVVNAAVEPADFRRVVAGEAVSSSSHVAKSGKGYVDVLNDEGRKQDPEPVTAHTVDVDA